jgi:hypothetical protein
MVTNMQGLSIDYSDVQRIMRNLNAAEEQIPFAMALALNRATENTRQYLIKTTWPGAIKQRNASFIAAALTTREARASKQSLATEIYENERMRGRGHLMLHAKGGTRTPTHGRARMTVPTRNVVRAGAGRRVPQNLRPKQLGEKLFTQKGNPDALYVRDRRGKLKLMYVLKTATRVPKRVPFFEDYHRTMASELNRLIPTAVQYAMATRRR